jgi:hypothetical protein
MGILNKLFGKKDQPEVKVLAEPAPAPKAKKPKAAPKAKPSKSAKELATENGEPWVSILNVDVDPENIGAGSFELDWNDKFLAQLIRAGYQVKPNEPENEIVDRWFQDVCRNVVLETFEQMEANNPRSNNRRDIGNGRSEIS